MIDPYEHLDTDIDLEADVESTNTASPEVEDLSEINSSIEEEFTKVGLRANALQSVSSALPDLYKFIGHVTDSFPSSPLDASIAHVLNDITEGAVDRYLGWYTSKRDILTLHVQKRGLEAIERAVVRVRDDLEKRGESYDTLRALDHIRAHRDNLYDYIMWQLDIVIDVYKVHCERLGQDVDENLINTGHLTTVNPYEEVYLKRPPRISQFFSMGPSSTVDQMVDIALEYKEDE